MNALPLVMMFAILISHSKVLNYFFLFSLLPLSFLEAIALQQHGFNSYRR